MTNPTSNYNFQMPTASDLVTDLPADFEVFGQAVDTRLKALQPGTTLGDLAYSSATANTNTRLGVGTTGQVLTVAAGVPSWATPSAGLTNPMTTTGDVIYSSSGSTPARLGIGSTGQVLTVAAGVPSWAAAPGSPFASDISVNGQTIGKGGGNIGNNTVHGTGGLAANTSGSQNTAIGGSQVLYQNTTGSYHTAIGAGAMQEMLTGVHCTAVGRQALNAATGDTNTAVGSNAGLNTTTGSNNSFLGYNSQPASASTSDSITLGNANITTLRCAVTSITSISDARDKKNIEPLQVGLDFVNELKPVTFDWNMRPTIDSDGNEIAGKVDMPDAGFIAQDFVAAEDAIGLADHLQLSMRENPNKLEISQGRLIPILVKAIQDLSAKVAALEAK